jgi:PAS domain S-box-containing protein
VNLEGIFLWLKRDKYFNSIRKSSKRRQSKCTLRDQRVNLLKTIVDMNRSGIISTDHNMIITICSPSTEQLLGLSKEEIIGKSLQEVLPNFNIDPKKIPESNRHNMLFNHNNKKIGVEAAPIILDDSDKVGMIMTLEDIADLQKKEER